MDAVLIPPIPDLHTAAGQKYHLLLPHLLRSGQYVEFFTEEATRGAELILDNGADEFGEASAQGFPLLLEQARVLGAKEVVLPDAQFSPRQTVEATAHALRMLMTPDGGTAYEAARLPRLMLVPQGTNYDSWVWCYTRLVSLAEAYLDHVGRPGWNPFVLGVAKNHDQVVYGGIGRLLNRIPSNIWAGRVHLLGWPKRLLSLHELSNRYRGVLRSVDSSRPYAYASAGLDMSEPRVLSGRGADRPLTYFEAPTRNRDILERNIIQFRRFANGSTPLEV